MSKVEFNEDQDSSDTSYNQYGKEPKGLIGLVIKFGLAKNEQGANKVLVIIGVATIVLMLGVFIFGGNNKNTRKDTFIPSAEDMSKNAL